MPALTAIARGAKWVATGAAGAVRAITDRATRLTVNAVQTTNRRRPLVARTRSEDDELYLSQRDQLVTGKRDLERNFSIAAWAYTHVVKRATQCRACGQYYTVSTYENRTTPDEDPEP